MQYIYSPRFSPSWSHVLKRYVIHGRMAEWIYVNVLMSKWFTLEIGCVHFRTWARAHVLTHARTGTNARARARTHAHAHIHTCTYRHIVINYTHIHTSAHKHTHRRARAHARTHARTHTHTHTHARTELLPLAILRIVWFVAFGSVDG